MISRIPRRLGFARFQGIRPIREGILTVRMVPDSAAAGVHVAFATPKRIGSAVVRNRVRRQVRALMHAQAATLPRGWYLIGIEAAPVDNSWGQLSGLLATALPRAVQRAKHQTSTNPPRNEVLL